MLPVLLLALLTFVKTEFIKLDKERKSLKMTFRLDGDNINTGYFNLIDTDNMKFQASIVSADENKILFSNTEGLPLNEKVRFSFNNSEMLDIVLNIEGTIIDSTKDEAVGHVEFVFDSALDTFNPKVSKKLQYEPILFVLNGLLKRLEEITETTRKAYESTGSLAREQKGLFYFVIFISNVSFAIFVATNIYQFYMMKRYLNKKKYL